MHADIYRDVIMHADVDSIHKNIPPVYLVQSFTPATRMLKPQYRDIEKKMLDYMV